MPTRDYDVVVIGSGSGGLTAARYAKNLGAKVALVEKLPRTGGDCTWHGCVPSKALIRCARAVNDAKRGKSFGVVGVLEADVSCDWEAVKRHVSGCQEFIYGQDDSPEVLQKEGVEVITNRTASFVSAYELMLATTADVPEVSADTRKSITADRFIIATGAGPSLPPITGLDQVPYVTYETVFTMDSMPKRLIVVGGGPIGAELAQAFARLGSEVTIVGKLMPREDQDVRKVMNKVFQEDGIRVVEGRATKVEQRPGGIIALEAGGQLIEADRLLVSAGRKPVGLSTLQLERAGVKYSDAGIQVNQKTLQTTASNIFAVGDCVGGLQFTHLAGYHGGVAAAQAVLPRGPWLPKAPPPVDCPRCTFTHPEVATVGLTQDEAFAKFGKEKTIVKMRSMSHVDRAVCEKETDGFIKIIYLKNGTVVGATVVAPVAGEMASELGLMIAAGIKIQKLASNMHAYPSFSFALFQMAAEINIESMKASSSLSMLKSCCGRRLRGTTARGKEPRHGTE
eukprot:TRINITY_DN6494_c0_g1_i1.p1 TRINITY_DN6494_c0_g1~~TRINITY_DN6494_c0_g1_i1.p1  ORF type:complete len:520 (+),score=90.36 TRINITY_DN6494_c0_g1_i1:31-1560(+)